MGKIKFIEEIKNPKEKNKNIESIPNCICYWCGAIYSKVDSLIEHQKYYCSSKNIEAKLKWKDQNGEFLRWRNILLEQPEYYDSVLIFNGVNIYIGHLEPDNKWYIDREDESIEITHWMNLPELP